MPLLYDITIPALTRGLGILATYMDTAEVHCSTAGVDPATLVGARLAPDMFPLSGQIQRASDTAKLAIPRLTTLPAPSFPDEEKTFAELRKRCTDTIAFLESVKPADFAGADEREVTLRFSVGYSATLTGAAYVSKFLLPNFYFHVTTAHAIMRHQGIGVGKLDYIGGLS